jgi:hypothetical protein
MQETDMDGPVRHSSLLLECEKHLKTEPFKSKKTVPLKGCTCIEFLSYTDCFLMSFLLYLSDVCHRLKQFVSIVDMLLYY